MRLSHKDEKEARLRDFVARHIESVVASGVKPQTPYRLIALSTESPPARALASLTSDLAAAGIAIEAIFLKPAVSPDAASLENARCRFAADSRYLDAHEQLVLDSSTSWIGDCMRRDPGKRDTYEHYGHACEITARHASCSFMQMWNAAGAGLAAARKQASLRALTLFDPALIAPSEQGPSPAIIRH
jgi:hypothetical protein